MPFGSVATFEECPCPSPQEKADAYARGYDSIGDSSSHYDRSIVVRIRSGVEGTRDTLQLMDRLIEEGKKSPAVAELSEEILSRHGGQPHNDVSQVKAVWRALAKDFFYVNDPRRLEGLRHPDKLARKMLDFIRGQGPKPIGDCDDYTILGRSLLEFLGYETKSRAVGTMTAGRYNHVYPMVRMKNGRWVGLEATIRKPRFGFWPASSTVAPMDSPNIGQMKILDPFKQASIEVLKESAPTILAPAVNQLTYELKFLRWAILAITFAGLGVGWHFFKRRAA